MLMRLVCASKSIKANNYSRRLLAFPAAGVVNLSSLYTCVRMLNVLCNEDCELWMMSDPRFLAPMCVSHLMWCRELKQKRKRDPARSDQPQRTKQKTAASGGAPGGASQTSTDVGTAEAVWGHKAGPMVPGDDSHVARPTRDSYSHQPSHTAFVDTTQQSQMSHDPHGDEPATNESHHDESPKATKPSAKRADEYRQAVSGLAEHAQCDSAAEGSNHVAEHLPGHLPDAADDEEEEEGVTDNEDTDTERKYSLPEIDVVN